MLPEIELDIRSLCRIEMVLKLPEPKLGILGHVYCFDSNIICDQSKKMGLNLDQFLTRHIGYGLSAKALKSKILVFYYPGKQVVFLCVCSKKREIELGSLASVTGYRDSGRDYCKTDATPILYYDGIKIFRLYGPVNSMGDLDEYYVSDFGSFAGLTLSETDRENYEMIRDNPEEYVDYSAVPRESEELVSWRGKEFVIHHVFWRTNRVPNRGKKVEGAQQVMETS